MTKSFYTNVQVHGSKILLRSVENGRRERRKVPYLPSLFVPSQKPTEFRTIHNEYLSEVKPGTMREARDFIEQYKDVQDFKIYGMQRYEYQFIADTYSGHIDWDIANINIVNIDIEVGSENGFPEPATASEPITAITLKSNQGKFIVLGCGAFNNKRDDVSYIQCRDEIDLIKRYIDEWSGNYPDIVTGWNVKFFDIPYLVNRIRNLFGEAMANRISPWNSLSERTVTLMGRDQKAYVPAGIAILDYIEMYRKFAPGGQSQESYKLDAICNVELGERKLSYEEYGSLHTLHKENYQLFIEYNIRDVELVEKLDDKLKLIELVLTLAYDNKCNYDDVFTQVRMWDVIIYNHLREKNIIIPQNDKHSKSEAYIGAFVKDPLLGKHNWVASFDLNSLYPHLIMQWNISPDTIIEPDNYDGTLSEFKGQNNVSIDSLLNQEVNTSILKVANVTLAPNGQFFSKERYGFLPELMETMYNDRSAYKKKAIEAKKELEKETDYTKRYDIEKRIARYNNLQLAKKVSLNSAYGALGNEFFRFFDVRQASAITTAGQLAIRWIENKLNEYMNKLLKTKEQDYVIASDTDSIYLSLDRLVSKTIVEQNPNATTKQIIAFMDKVCEDRIQPFIDQSYGELAEYVNAYEQKMQMKREALADKGIWTAKKRYILNVYNNEGVEYAKPKVKVMGLEMVKSSTPSYCRKILWESIDIVLNKTQAEMLEFIDYHRSEFMKQQIADIAFPRGVNGLKKFSDKTTIYGKGCPIHVRGSLIYNNFVRTKKLDKVLPTINEGEKIKFIFLKEPNHVQSNVIAFPQSLPKEFALEKYIDYNMQFDKSFVEPLKIILDSIGWKTEHVSSLEDFFS
jgi:DNA polymerase elongation subunit (family B)